MGSGDSNMTQRLRRPNEPSKERIGRYDLIHTVGQGVMSTVYAARISGTDDSEKLSAVKVIHPTLVADRSFADLFLDEARLASRIHHPHVTEIFEVGEEDGRFFMVEEFVLGQSLRSMLGKLEKRGKFLSQPLAAHVAACTCAGLHAAHELADKDGRSLNLVHRDVSPSNILIYYEGFVKLSDFGVAWAKDRIQQTDAGALKGKKGYLSPEQVKGATIDRRSDIFSLGIVMYEMLTGQHPYPGPSDQARWKRALASDFRFRSPRDIHSSIASELEQIILKAMALSPDDRFPTAAAMGEALNTYIRSQSEPATFSELSILMNDLFSREIVEHQEKLKSPRITSVPSIEENESGPAGTPSPSAVTPAAISHSMSRTIRRRGRFRIAAVVGAIAIAGAIALLVVFPESVRVVLPPQRDTHAAPQPAPAAVLPAPERAAPKPEVRSPIAEKDAAPASVLWTLDILPRSTRLTLDGEPIQPGTSEIRLPSDGRIHTLQAMAAGYKSATYPLAADQDRVVRLHLEHGRARGARTSRADNTKTEPEDESLNLKESPY